MMKTFKIRVVEGADWLKDGRWLATGMRSGAGRLAGSPSRSGGSGVVDPLVAELVAKESIAAT